MDHLDTNIATTALLSYPALDIGPGLRRALELIPDATSVSRISDGLIVDVNQHWPDLFGYSREEVVGVYASDLNVWCDAQERQRIATALQEHGVVRDGETVIRRKSGELRQISYSVDKVWIGGEAHALAVVRDITERRRAAAALEDSRRMMENIVNSASDAIITADGEGRVVVFNAAAERMFRCAAADVLGKSIQHFIPERLRAQMVARLSRLAQAARVGEELTLPHDELYATRSDGEEFPFEFNMSRVEGAGEPLFTTIMRDVSDRRNAEAALRAKEMAEQASAAKTEFLSRVSHELRTPLNAILGFAQLLAMNELPSRQRHDVDHIMAAGKHLLGLINDVLDISRIESGQLALVREPVALGEVVDEAVALLQSAASERKITINLPAGYCPERVLGDRERLKQVLINLLSNAIKYNQPGGSVDVSWQLRGGRQRLLISDSGSGIAAADLARLFVPFDRLDAAQNGIEGSGLGLVLTRNLIEVMGGSIGVDSTPGRGSTFWIELQPAPSPAPVAPEQVTAPGRAGLRGRVLYIEDNKANLRLMGALLADYPALQLLHAPNGETGLDMVAATEPDLILLDLHLPDIGGHEVLRRLRAAPASAAIPVVILSADPSPDQAQRSRTGGATDYLTKPLDLDRLLRLIASVLAPAAAPA